MTYPDTAHPGEPPASAGTETTDLLARSLRLEAMLAQTNRHLRTLEEQFSSSESIASFGHFKIDREDRFLLSRSAQDLLGVSRAVAHLDQAFAAASSADCDRIGDAIRRLNRAGTQVDEEIALEVAPMGTRWLRVVVRNTQGAADAELYGLIIDITVAKREALRRDIALKVSEVLLQDVDSLAAYDWVLQSVCTGLGWDIGTCWINAGDGRSARCLAVWARADERLQRLAGLIRGRSIAPGEGMVGAVIASRQAQWSENVGRDSRFALRADAARAGIHSAYTFPIIVGDAQCAGALQFLSRSPRRADAQLPGLSELIGALLAQRLRREAWVARLREVAERDVLTGLLTRFALAEAIGAAAAVGQEFAVLSFDLNRFRLVNDALGHAAGDAVLRKIAERVRARLPSGALLARMAGDEFAALVPGGAQAAERAQDEIVGCVAAPLTLDGYEFSLTASVASALWPAEHGDAETLLRTADQRRHRAKRLARGTHTVPGVGDGDPLGEIRTEHELRHGIDNGELVVHYQPIVRLGMPGIVGAEALIRWRHPQRGLLAPASFLSVAEGAGLTRAISRAVLSQVTRDLASAGPALARDFRVNINLSALDFRDLKLFKEIGELLRETGMAPQRLRFEVTEGMLMEDVGTAERVVGLLADFGVEFAIDDFGTGYSSLAQLARLPVHELKIDHSFTHSIGTPRGKTVVRAVLDLAARLEMPVTAEGIETRTQALALSAYGCAKGQGYLFARAMAFPELLVYGRTASGAV
ncbi:MAG: bifunctional diguanylate cyclase/phosphodiesterase [Burkholderiales bacterium]|nr:bifunctional diguanylate cyclase/phosphodiesterase [Burkholderiales bacterium]